MVEVEKYIKRLLYDQDCVIIPDFGGVLTHYLPARFEQSSGTYLPSERKVAFNEVLKIDDGLLAKFISENEGLPYAEARRHIRDFVQTVQSLVKKNKTVTLGGIGSFHLNPEGRLVFQPDNSRNFHAEFYGLSPVGASDLKQQPPVREEKPVKYEIEVSSPGPYIAPSKKIAWGNWISAASIACILVYVSAVLSREPGETSSLSPIETVRSLFAGPVEEAGAVTEGPKADVRDMKVVEEAVVTPAGAEEEAVATDVAVLHENPAGAEHKFFVIASVYESRSSLDKYGAQMAEKLRSQGYESVRTLTVRDKYMLSAGAFDTWNEAQKVIPALSKTAKGAWIYKRR
ncbi:MAG: hypothetical protein ABS46_19360 [Cytophagaceae bacterium SCN 52-12]|nr:MAG: hypothetical protein ABS46_19360 [Cytophagaceae bacterium SCN 52-12]